MRLASFCLFSTLAISAAQISTCSAQTTTQASNATLSGVVTDSQGASLPKATVVLEADGFTRRVTADAGGRFQFTNLAPGTYALDVDAPGFATSRRTGVTVTSDRPTELSIPLQLGDLNEQVVVDAEGSTSLAAQSAPIDARLDESSARTEISQHYIQNYLSPVADFSEIIQNAPGTFSVNSNGVGLGDSKTYFRGFADGNYDITFDGIPFNDTNSPTHHSWSFFPSQWIGGVDFDRSPGSASTIGPTPFGGSINLLSEPMPARQNIRGTVAYGSFNTQLYEGNYDSGNFGPGKKMTLWADIHHMSSDGFQTFNYQSRWAGALKFQDKFSDSRVLTGFAGVLHLDTNTPNFKGPLRSQYLTQYNLLLNNDPTSANYYKYNWYILPTDFEYVGYRTAIGHGWYLDSKGYTYSYNNHQNYTNTQNGVINAACAVVTSPASGKDYPCGTDKLNSYRKYGETSTISQVSRYGILRTGLWYEWATTNRYQIPQNPLTGADSLLPNFHETFYTNSYQPFAEYEWHPTGKLTVTGGMKFARYTQALTQYADNGKTIGNTYPGTTIHFTSVKSNGAYNSYLPAGSANYRIRDNWSAYFQGATGSDIPPSSVFDVAGATVNTFPAPTTTLTFQGGTVLKLRRLTLDADYYHIHFGNSYTAVADPSLQSGFDYYSSGDSVTKGFEGEASVSLTHGLTFYVNGTVGSAHYVSPTVNGSGNVNYNLWVANTPANTQALGLTYAGHGFDMGMFNKRVGPMWNDNGSFNQVVPIAPFSITNLFFNYGLRGRLEGTKLKLSFNNLFDTRNIISVTPANKGAIFTPNANDSLGLTPGRSVMLSVTFGYSPD
jgi:iron complex outermembrane receptor protein